MKSWTASVADSALPELADMDWLHHAETVAGTGFWSVARRLPTIVREALGLAWSASRRDTLAALLLNVVAGVMTMFGLLATSDVLRALFADGPTPDRVRQAVPALVTAAAAVALRGGLGIAAGWAQARLAPQINYAVELRMFEATTGVELAAFDDPGFAEEMARARDRGMSEAATIVSSSVDLLTGGTPSVTEAAQRVGAHELIRELPHGYDTLLNKQFKNGHDLSCGQWQRLVAARGLYRDAAILIADEPSASLDARAEHLLFGQLRRHPDRAVVLITHRLANVRHADQIYVLHHGRLLEHGTHSQLMAAGGRYAELFTLQAAGYLDPADLAIQS